MERFAKLRLSLMQIKESMLEQWQIARTLVVATAKTTTRRVWRVTMSTDGTRRALHVCCLVPLELGKVFILSVRISNLVLISSVSSAKLIQPSVLFVNRVKGL